MALTLSGMLRGLPVRQLSSLRGLHTWLRSRPRTVVRVKRLTGINRVRFEMRCGVGGMRNPAEYLSEGSTQYPNFAYAGPFLIKP